MINIILAVLTISQFSPMPKFDSRLSWRTLESEHFAVHFSNQYSFEIQEELAREIISYCEDAYNKLTHFMNWRPNQKTNVIIGDFYDYVSGWATPFPHNTIFVCPTFDKNMRVNYSDWLQQLIIHEYTHILNMDMDYGIPKFFRKIFGRIIVPNTVMPLFLQEGFSVYNETKFTGLGRSQSSYYQMMMRSAVLIDNFFSIDKCVTYDIAQYPGGETPYFYGSQFYEYLALKYGDNKLAQYSNWLSGGLPLFYNTQAKRVFGKSLSELWQDFKHETEQTYTNQVQEIQTKPITSSAQLTFSGYYTASPIFALDNKIYYVKKTNLDYPCLQELDLTSKKIKTLLKKNISSAIRLSQDGTKLIFSIQDYYKNYYRFDDLYIYDLTRHTLERLTNGLRASDADISPDNKKVVYVHNESGQTNLCLSDLYTRQTKQVTHSEDFSQYSNPKFSPDGNKIAVAIWKSDGEQDIYIYDLLTDWLAPVTQDRSLEIEPNWSKDGKYLIFSSDRTGVFNIFAYYLETDRLYQITNVLTGAFSPALSQDNTKLLFQLYSSKGYDIHIMDFNVDTITSLVIASDSVAISDISYNMTTDSIHSELYHYNPFPSIYPKFWLPWIMYDNRDKWSYGTMTCGADALFQHQYLIQACYNVRTKQPVVYFDYILDKFYPTILVNTSYEYRRLKSSIASRFSFIKNDYQQYLTTSCLFDKYYKYYNNGLGIFYQFNSTKYYPYSISLEQGRYLGIKGEIFDKTLLSYDNRAGISLVFAEYLKLPFPNHVLMLNANIGFTWGSYFYTIGGPKASFTIRGNDQRYSEHNGISLITEYRFPLFWIERGLGTLPIFFQNMSGKIFFDIGKGFSSLSNFDNSQILKGTGLELSLQTLFFFQVPVKFSFGVASDLSRAKVSQYYFNISPIIPFLTNGLFKEFDL